MNNAITFKTKVTKKITKKDIEKILKLKNSHWKYTLKNQLTYFLKNYNDDDLHNMMFFKKKFIGYTALRKKKIKDIKYLIFDTLVIDKKFRSNGLGLKMMKFNNKIIKNKKLPSILICRKKIKKFYEKNKWKKFNKIYNNKYLMIFNQKKTINLLGAINPKILIFNKKSFD